MNPSAETIAVAGVACLLIGGTADVPAYQERLLELYAGLHSSQPRGSLRANTVAAGPDVPLSAIVSEWKSRPLV